MFVLSEAWLPRNQLSGAWLLTPNVGHIPASRGGSCTQALPPIVVHFSFLSLALTGCLGASCIWGAGVGVVHPVDDGES